MRWGFSLIFCLVLLGCDTPSPHFRGLPATQVSVAGSVFDVRVRGEMAEAIRRNAQYAPRLGKIGPRAALAMQQVSGCKVEYLLGDAAVTLGLLQCDGVPRDWRTLIASLPRDYLCDEVATLSRDSYTSYECSPY